MKTISRFTLALTLFAPGVVAAQDAATPPTFNVLNIYRETVKPGKGVEHDAHEVAWSKANIAAKHPVPMLAIRAMSGVQESWYMTAFPTWEAYEKATKMVEADPTLAAIDAKYSAKEGEYLADARGMILRQRVDLSYGPPINLGAMRYMTVTRTTVRPGHVPEFEENRKLVKAAHEAAHLSDGYSIWEATSGAPAGTFYMMVARKSLAELDSGSVIHNAAYIAALGGPEGQKKLNANQSSAVVSTETNQFSFLPLQSNPAKEWLASDGAYWSPKRTAKK